MTTYMPTVPMRDVIRLTRLRDRRRAALATTEAELNDAIRTALAAGERAAMLAFVADVTRQRVYQIRDRKR